MSPERWQRVRDVFDRAVECAPSEAEDVLRAACGDDTALYDEVRRMLDEQERSSPLDRAVWERTALGVFRAGQTVAGRYRIVRYLNRGGMGEVYEARDLELNERVALKTILPEVASDARMIGRFKQEIQLSRKIAHPNVCRVFDLARHPAEGSSPDTVYFLTMEFLDGETLAARLEREGPMRTDVALPLLEQMARGLDAAHAAGVIHRDFKPTNVMLTEAGGSVACRAVVTDFGLARSETPPGDTATSMSGRVMGTVDYMAPELLTGSTATFASDVYALGMVAYKMITGALPFASDTPLAGAILRSKQPIPSPRAFVPGLDPRWERGIVRALSADPSRRFASAGEFIRALRGESSGITVALPVMTRRRWAVVGVAATVAAGAWLGWGAWSNAAARPSAAALSFYREGVEQIHNGAYFAATRALMQAETRAPNAALVHARLAEAWLGLDAPEKASRQMVAALNGNLSALPKTDRLQISAIGHLTTREYQAAAADYEKLVAASPSGDLDFYLDLGTTYLLGGQQARAITSYKKAADSAQPRPAAWMWLGLAYARAAKDQAGIALSEQAFQKADEGYRFNSNLEGITALAYRRGVAASRRVELDASNAFLRQAVESARMGQNPYFEIAAKAQMSLNASTAGDAALGEQLAREALETAQANQMEMLSLNCFVSLATARLQKGDDAGAERYYRDALLLAQKDNSLRWVAQAELWLAVLHDRMHLPDDAAREAKEALAYFEPQHWDQETLRGLTILGRSQSNRGNYSAAADSFGRLLKITDSSHDRRARYLALEGLGSVLSGQENYPAALEHFEGMMKLSSSPEEAAYAALRCGRTQAILGHEAEARSLMADVDPEGVKSPPLRFYLASARAEASLSQERFADAIRQVREVQTKTQAPNGVASANLSTILGLALLRSGNVRQGAQQCEDALRSVESSGDPAALMAARVAILEARVSSGQEAEAKALFNGFEASLGSFPESGWRALAIIAGRNPEYRERARQALADLERQWGGDVYAAYIRRPDIHRLAWPLIAESAANRK